MSLVCLIIYIYIAMSSAAKTFPVMQDLCCTKWLVHNANKSIECEATIPGGIYSDLQKCKILSEDIFYRFNDEEYRWVAKDNWTYSTSFNVDFDVSNKETIYLEFEGLDTVASVILNSHRLGETNNMFVLYKFEVKKLLQVLNNTLVVQFTSPIWAAQEAATKLPYQVPPACVPAEYHGECHANYLRKMQASFAWDWGPAYPSVGIWKKVLLHGYNKISARYVGVETRPEETHWRVSVTLYLDVTSSTPGTLTASLILNSRDKISVERQITVTTDESNPTLVFSVKKDEVSMWWPNGYGSQPLYKLIVGFHTNEVSTQKSVKVGFRTVNLVQVEAVPSVPEKGLTFYFRVNGEAIFAKGSNYIPLHILPELSAEPSGLYHLLKSARDANMNMLRIWGGGLYESDLFYEICDELGLLIWQDLMFACSMYPSTPEFLDSVSSEVNHQVKRLQHHACIGIWAGNNENEAALSGNWYGTEGNFSLFKHDYVKLYVETIKPIIQYVDKTRTYVISSPSNGLQSEREGYVAKNPYDNKFGDVHWYEYIMNLWNPVIFPKTRFASEYGVMSMPSMESFMNCTIESDRSLTSELMTRRQHHLGGYEQMIHEIKQQVNIPSNDTIEFEDFIYLSQINQAMSIKTETEAYRRNRNILDSAGEGLTMGALYWQLNDVWQAPSWSSIEFNGKWKILHYFAVDFFSPVLVSPSVDVTNTLQVYVISDLKLHISLDLQLKVYIYSWKSFNPVFILSYPFKMLGPGILHVASLDVKKILGTINDCKSNDNPENTCFFYFSLLAQNTSISFGPNNFYFPTALRSIHGLRKANIKVKDIVSLKGNHELMITLSSDAIALFVWLDTNGVKGHFSHNGFLMVTSEIQLVFTSREQINLDLFKNSLKILCLSLDR